MSTWKPIETAPKDGTPILVGGFQPAIHPCPSPTWESTTVYWTKYVSCPNEWHLVATGSYADDGDPDIKITH